MSDESVPRPNGNRKYPPIKPGNVYDRLTVISLGQPLANGRKRWICECICGKRTLSLYDGLVSGRARSCGCTQITGVIGRAYNRLTIIGRAPSDAKGNAMFHCLCQCGKTTTVYHFALTSGRTKSCGCYKMESIARVGRASFVDLAGKVYGRLTVVDRASNVKNHTRWNCVCICGVGVIAKSAHLTSEAIKSCGCIAVVNLLDKVFGWLTVIRKNGTGVNGALWLCVCKCGKEKTVSGGQLTFGCYVSCGCAARQSNGPMRSQRVRELNRRSFSRRRAKIKGGGGSHTKQELLSLYLKQKGRCAEATCRIRLYSSYERDHIICIDDGGSDYISNIQLLCQPCNRRKSHKNPFEWANANGRLL